MNVSIHVALVAVIVLAGLLLPVLAAIVLLAARRRRAEAREASALQRARPRMRAALEQRSARDGANALVGVSPGVLRAVLWELGRTLSGESRRRLQALAAVTGLTTDAQARCGSRRYPRRLKGVRLLIQLGGGEEVVPGLLADRSSEVRAAAATWSAQHPQAETIACLLGLLEDRQPLVRFAAQSALLEIGDRAVAPVAEHLAQRGTASVHDVLRVAVALSDRRLLAPALEHRDSPDPATRALVADLAGAAGGEQATTALLEMLSDRAPVVRAGAAQGLGGLRYWPAGGPLRLALADSAWLVRKRAALALRSLGAPGLLLLRAALEDPDRFARDIARQVLDLPDTPGASSA
jgi:HEAT repeats